MANAFQQILYEVDDPVATITLNRPDQLNAWTARMGHEVAAAVGLAEVDPNVVGIVITGAGRGFCAGADLGMLAGVTDSAGDAGSREDAAAQIIDAAVAMPGDPGAGADLRGTYTYLMSVAKPVIAAINGAVAGMGVPVTLACDLRFMSTTAVLTTSFAQRGLIAEWGIAWQLSRLVGPANALDLLFSARKVGGDEAARIGLVNRAVAARRAARHGARRTSSTLAENCSPTSIAVMKRQVYLDLHRGLGEAQTHAEGLMTESFGRADFQEGVQSFLQRRPPKFDRIGDDLPRYRTSPTRARTSPTGRPWPRIRGHRHGVDVEAERAQGGERHRHPGPLGTVGDLDGDGPAVGMGGDVDPLGAALGDQAGDGAHQHGVLAPGAGHEVREPAHRRVDGRLGGPPATARQRQAR